MRTYEEIKAEINSAMTIKDADALRALAEELKRIPTPEAAATAANAIATVYHYKGDFASALEHYQRALQVHEELGNRFGVASVTSNIGGVFNATGDYQLALEHYRRALHMYEEQGDRAAIA